jgi:hypothetical protein
MQVRGHDATFAPPGRGPRIGRRALAAGLAALAAAPPARAGSDQPRFSLPPGDALTFRIQRDGAEVGSHRVAFEQHGSLTVARAAIDITVVVAWITVYRFTHRATETWQGERFGGIESHTDDNGTTAWMRTVWDPEGALRVSGSGTAPYAAPPGALASTYWNPAVLRAAPVISSQDGQLSAQRVVAGPLEQVPCVHGSVLARRHTMFGKLDMDIWYDLDDRWAHMRFRRDGAVITYLRA